MMTTKSILNDLREVLTTQYRAQLEALPIKRNTRECLIDGFRAGVLSGVHHTCKLLEVEVVDK